MLGSVAASLAALSLQQWALFQAMASGQPLPPEFMEGPSFTPSQRDEITRGVDKITTFPLDGACSTPVVQ